MEGVMGNNKRGKAIGWVKSGGWLLLISLIVLTGCQGPLLSYKGEKVRNVYRIALADGTQKSDRYESPHLTIDYYRDRNGNELRLSGTVTFTSRVRNNFTVIPNFYLTVFFTDAKGTILEEKGIPTPGVGDPEHPMRFNEMLLLPPGTTHMAFSYSGQGRIGSGRSGGATTFVLVPIVE
jgi:hypothetical protein